MTKNESLMRVMDVALELVLLEAKQLGPGKYTRALSRTLR